MRTSLYKIRRDVKREQVADHETLKGAVVGRKLDIETPEISFVLKENRLFEPLGHLAVVYIFSDEMKRYKNKTYFNTRQVDLAIDQAPANLKQEILVGRDELHVAEDPVPGTEGMKKQRYWLTSRAVNASLADDRKKSVSVKNEKLAIANNLFLEDNDLTQDPVLWLGAVRAKDYSTAIEALDDLEDYIPTRLKALPAGLLPYVPNRYTNIGQAD